MPFLPLYFRVLGVTNVGAIAVWTGVSVGITPAVAAIMTPLWGKLGDRIGRKPMVARALMSFIVVMTALAFVTAPWQVLALRFLHGVFAGYGALTLAMAAESAPPDRMARAIGLVQMARRLGPTIGPLIGGLVAAVVGLRQAFLVAAFLYLLAMVVMLSLYREPSRISSPSTDEVGRHSVRQVIRFEGVALMMSVIFAMQYVERSLGPVLSLFVASLGVSIEQIPLWSGILFSLVAGAGAVGNHVCSRLLERYSPGAVILASIFVAACVAASVSGATQVVLLVAVLPLFGLAIGTGTTAAYTIAGHSIPSEAQGVGFSVLSSASMAALALSPVLSGLLGSVSLRSVFLVDVALLAGLGVIGSRKFHRIGAMRNLKPVKS
ncbi:MAG TPA: MFS transporter [Nitrospirales bacterium]|jgi:MFS family permease|nr:MFS transporter [Nitrospirales bacterium]